MKSKIENEKLKEILTRGVDEVIEKDHLSQELLSKKILRVKFGIDPTSPDLHLGHSIPLMKLKQFQDLGHKIILLIGDFTAKIGDPSGRSETRKVLSEKQIKNNMKDYIGQASKIINIKKSEIRYNSEWYKKKGAMFLFELSSKITLSRVIERDDFKKRMKENRDISMLETLYPLMQGYDSVELKADVEIGGRDQKFNLLMGRRVQKKYGMKEQDILTTPLLEGTDGIRKMSKSYKNYIGLAEDPFQIYGKIMSIADDLMWKYFELLTSLPIAEIEEMRKKVSQLIVLSPKDVKKKLAREIVATYYNKKEAEKAEKEFEKIFSKKEIPDNIPEIEIKEKTINILDLLIKVKLTFSKSEAKRLVEQGGVKINGRTEKDWRKKIEIKPETIIQAGKRKFIKIK